MKELIRKITPRLLLRAYHFLLAKIGSIYFGHPSRRMVVIGVTGTKGKSTVVNLISAIFETAGYKTGIVSTVNFKVADREWKNETKQTMPGRFKLQSLLADMVKAGCEYAVIETSSEGIVQYRHVGIDYDAAVLTNLTPEHIESHGNFNNYRAAKLKLFQSLYQSKRKIIKDKKIKKLSVVNHDDREAEFFLLPKADRKITYGLQANDNLMANEYIVGEVTKSDMGGVSFRTLGHQFNLNLLGDFNVYNALAALTVTKYYGVDLKIIKKSLESIQGVPGRMEEVRNDKGFKIFVDYAHEPASLEAVYKTLQSYQPKRIISILGSQGGGRDKAKRPILGELAAHYTDYVIVTNEDPYDEEPEKIIDDIIKGATQVMGGPVIEKIVDRKKAIEKAINIAEKGDIIIITGKGSETIMAVAEGKMVPWNDKKEIKELLNICG